MWDIKTLKKTFNLNKLFKEYNAKYFKGKLGDVVFDVYVVGEGEIFSYALENTRKKRNGGYSANIKFNAMCEWNDKSIRETLLHEMIHYYQFVLFGRSPIFGHGISFTVTQLRLLLCYGVYVPRYGDKSILKKESPLTKRRK